MMRRLLLVPFLTLAVTSTSWAQPARGVAWAWVSGTYVSPAYQFNSAGGAITVTRDSTGSYTVAIPNMGTTGGTVHVVAYNGNHYCNAGGWYAVGTTQSVSVRCFSAGVAADGAFSVLFYKEDRENAEWSDGYLWANEPSAASYTPSSTYQWNSRGYSNTVKRTSTGRYTATFPGLGPLLHPGSVMVTAYQGNSRCRVESWGGTTNLWVQVACDTPAGNPVDTRYDLSFISDTAFGVNQGQEQRRGAFVWADDAHATSYTPEPLYQYNGAGGPIRIRRQGNGQYEVDIPGLIPAHSSNVQVTRHSGAGHCNVYNWLAGPSNGTTISIRCYNTTGILQDARYALTYLTSQPATAELPPAGGPSRAKAWVWSDGSTDTNPNAYYQFNSAYGTNAVTRLAAGRYRVEFPGLGTAGGIVHVNAYREDAYCKAHSWGPNGTTQEVYVLCFGSVGTPVDSYFSVLFYKEARTGSDFNAGYARSLIPITSAAYSPPSAYSWNGRLLGNAVNRVSVGRYEVTFSGLVQSPNGGSVMVTPYGSATTRCKVANWYGTTAVVLCHTADGTPTDAEFGVSYFVDVAFGSDTLANGYPGAYAWAHDSTEASYEPAPAWRYNSVGGTFLATRDDVGHYSMEFGRLKALNKTMPIVTAYGTLAAETGAYCHPFSWAPTATGTAINVRCFKAGGVPVDSRYTVVYLTTPHAPSLSDIADQTVPMNGSTGALECIIDDVDTPAGSLTVAGTSADPVLVPESNIVVAGTGATRTVTVTPATNRAGTTTVAVTVIDDRGLSTTDTFLLTVTNTAPTISDIGDRTVLKNGTSGPIPFTVGDAEAAAATLQVSGSSSNPALIPQANIVFGGSAADRTVTVTPAADQVGTATITVTVSDGALDPRPPGLAPLTTSDTFLVTVPSELTYYLAEGATGPFFDLELALANPNGAAAPVSITYLKGDGSTVAQSLTLGAQSRHTVLVDAVAGVSDTAVSTVVSSTDGLPLAVERTMTWDETGYGSHTERATLGAALTWYFAEGSEQASFDTYLLLANPQPTANKATVVFLVEGGSPVTKVYDLPPTSRTNVWAEAVEEPAATKILLGRAFGMVVTFDQPGVAERAMYFGTTPFWNAGHEAAGVTAPSTSWFHAEGATGAFFDTFILLSNPGSTPATVTLRFLLDTGTTVTKSKTVAPSSRLTVGVETEDPLLADAALATEVTSNVPIVSERAMYWAQYPNWYEAHDSFGVTATTTKWVLGEGRVGGSRGYETYILLANPGTTTANVTVSFLREGGLPPIVQTYTVPATSRFNVYANGVPGLGSGERFGALIESTNGVPIVVERAMYSNSPAQPGISWAAGTNATATPIP